MMKDNITKLYSFIAKLMALLEEEIFELENKKSKNAILVKKNITETITKLVNLLAQLNKMSKEETNYNDEILSRQDENIINIFMEKYK